MTKLNTSLIKGKVMTKNTGSWALLLSFVMLAGGLASPDAAHAKKKKKCSQAACGKDIVDTAKSDGSFKSLSNALTSTGLSKTLKGKGPFTVFAPTDEALAKLPKAQKDELLSDPSVLKYHVVKGVVPSSDLKDKRSVVTVQGESLMVDTKNDGEVIVVDGAVVTKPDIKCNNGVIHVIDFVLVPERGK
ncbi:MAG: fasciclin domain-containing protein [Candidatus Obscuribacterales bacterium]|nr:fasciclin domain-containing protein [Candidatus Obscuribacterales bacterium]